MTLPSWDIIVVILVVLWLAFAFVILRSRVMSALLAAYTAFLVTITWGPNLHGLLTGKQAVFGFSFSLSVSEFAVKSCLLVILWLLLTALIPSSKRKRIPEFETIGHALFTIGFILSSIVTFMSDDQKKLLGNRAVIAEYLGRYHSLLILLPVILILYSSLHAKDEY